MTTYAEFLARKVQGMGTHGDDVVIEVSEA